MKKIMMMAAVAAAVLTSCSNSELIELSDSRAIGFETYVGKASTRGLFYDMYILYLFDFQYSFY